MTVSTSDHVLDLVLGRLILGLPNEPHSFFLDADGDDVALRDLSPPPLEMFFERVEEKRLEDLVDGMGRREPRDRD